MTIPIDPITNRKLILVKQLYEQADKQSALRYSFTNRILCVIGFDLAIETLLKVIVGGLDQQKQPSDNFPGLMDQCDNLLKQHGLPLLPYRRHVLFVHSVRNDAQHKAKYPNEINVNDCRTYARDFCREIFINIWGLSFDRLSSLEWVDDKILKELLEISKTEINNRNYKKAVTLAAIAFSWASESIFNFLPKGTDGLYEGQVPELGNKTIKYINAVLKDVENTSKHYAALMTTGINVVDYRRFRELTPSFLFRSSSSIQAPNDVKRWVDVYWAEKEPNEETTLWIHSFVINSIVNWQSLSLSPNVNNDDKMKWAQMFINWDNNQINIK